MNLSASKVLVISLTHPNVSRDPRVFRQICFLKKMGFQVSVLGLGSVGFDDVPFYRVTKKRKVFQKANTAMHLLCRCFHRYYWQQSIIQQALQQVDGKHFDLYLANEMNALPLALKLANGGKVFLDLHEYEPQQFENHWKWKLFFQPYMYWLCRHYLAKTDAITTVCQGIADEYHKQFGVNVDLLTNAPWKQDLNPQPIKGNKIRMIYQGMGAPQRHVMDVVNMVDDLDDRFELDMILVPGDEKYIREVKQKAQSQKKIRFLDPVPMPEIPKLCNQYDLGIYPLQPISLNHYYSLPNKIFEFVQSRVGIVVYPLPEMKRIITQYGCGVVANDFNPKTFAQTINRLSSEDIWQMKQKANQAAQKLCAEENQKKFAEIVDRLL